ncbi:hypothetical protein [Pseudomonas sp. LH1G9]|uniref:hypothetical protein n=1 Tax=Pseudomonas sp. LH1G9 TaxID=2083055 RepID=UPI000CF35BAA|nr:hypothetical protein [Pseudomonas sp. LH1G9]
MKYQTGSFAGSENLMQIVREKLFAEGWLIDLHAYVDIADTRFGKRLHMHKGATYIALRSFDDFNPTGAGWSSGYGKSGIDMRISTGFDAAQSWFQQPGYSNNGRYIRAGSSGTYHLFTADARVLLISEFENGRYSHAFFGDAPIIVAGTGGSVLTGMEYASGDGKAVPFDHSGAVTSLWISKADYSGWLYSYQDSGTRGFASGLSVGNGVRVPNFSPSSPAQVGTIGSSARSSNRLNGLSALMPVYTYVLNDSAWSPFAEFDDLYFVNCDLMAAGQDYMVGDQVFKIFPFFGKEIPAVRIQPYFGLGFAVKVDA